MQDQLTRTLDDVAKTKLSNINSIVSDALTSVGAPPVIDIRTYHFQLPPPDGIQTRPVQAPDLSAFLRTVENPTKKVSVSISSSSASPTRKA